MKPGLTMETSTCVRHLMQEIQTLALMNTQVHASPAANNLAMLAAEMLHIIDLAIQVNESIGIDSTEIAKLKIAAENRNELEHFIMDYIRDKS